MPIIGMTRKEDVTPQFPDLGKLRKGAPKTTNRPGIDLEYWRFTSDRPEVVAAFYTAYSQEPKTIHAYLPFPQLEENWQTWREEYDAGGMVHRCNGQFVTRWRDASGQYQGDSYTGEAMPCPYANGARERTKERPGCIQVGRLALIVPELIEAGHVGFVTMETHSINDLVSITACLTDIERRSSHGLTGILLNVMRVPEVISTPAWDADRKANGKRNRVLKFLVQVVPAAEWVQAQLSQAKLLALPGATLPELTDEGSIDANVTLAEEVTDVVAETQPGKVQTVGDLVNKLMREAAERDGADPQPPKANGLEAVGEAYAEHGFHQMEAAAITNIIFPGGIETHGQAATLYFWLREPDPTDVIGKRYRKCEATTAEATAILASIIMTDADEDLPFSDEPEDEDA